MTEDEKWMRRALKLAVRARHASPNPSVGCVLVSASGVKIGEGWTQPPGQNHAERQALLAAGETARGATAYVTLEPCSHFGRTPPCADALIAAGVSRVVAAMADPDSRVSGRGFDALRAAGVTVRVGLCEDAARDLNAAYVKQRLTGLPFVTLKTAQTLDGKIATASGDSRWISSAISRRAVHRQLRDRCDAILTGIGTILADDPSLTTRFSHRPGRNPLRVVVDSLAQTPLDSRVVRQSLKDNLTLFAVTPTADSSKIDALISRSCRVWICESDALGRVVLPGLMRRLGTEGPAIGVLAECGGTLAAALLRENLIDRWLAFVAPKVLGGTSAPGPIGDLGIEKMGDANRGKIRQIRRSGPDIVIDTRFG